MGASCTVSMTMSTKHTGHGRGNLSLANVTTFKVVSGMKGEDALKVPKLIVLMSHLEKCVSYNRCFLPVGASMDICLTREVAVTSN